MKKTTRIITFIIAFILVLSYLTMPASALVNDEIEPKIAYFQCSYCGGNVPYIAARTEEDKQAVELKKGHIHYHYKKYNIYQCSNCGEEYKKLIQQYDTCSYGTCPGN